MKAKKSGFTLVEILIVVVILGILAAIVIPQFTDASTEAKTSSLASNLQMLRAQIELYKIQHNDNPPSGVGSTFVNQMTTFSSVAGATNASETAVYCFGPYMRDIPVEPFTNSDVISAAGTSGWNYTVATGEIWAPYDPNY
jgi:type II secretion system protein G